MQIKLPDINLLIKKILPVKSSFTGDFILLAQGKTITQSVEQWRKSYLKELSQNKKGEPIQTFNTFTTNLLIRAMRGEKGVDILLEMNKKFKALKDITENKANNVLKKAKYRWGAEKGTKVILGAKRILFEKYHGKWDKYFKKAKENYRSNFLNDDFLKIKGVSFKVRDLALSCFLKEYSANDFHVVDVLVRTGLILYGYGDLNFGTNPNNEKNYLFLRNLIIKISKQTRYSPGEIDRIFWHFGRAICRSKPLCEECSIKNICLTYKNNKQT